jgi:hypothetical protein
MTARVIRQDKSQKQLFLVYITTTSEHAYTKSSQPYEPWNKNTRPAFNLEFAKVLCT